MASRETPYRIVWRPMAVADLRAITAYIGKDNPSRALTFRQDLLDTTSKLAQHPELGRSGRLGLPAGVRELVLHRNYIAFCRLPHAQRLVEILRVKHAAQQTP